MYAVIKTGGKQYRVSPGDLLVVEKLPGDVGAEVAFNEVLMLGEDGVTEIGAPLIEGAVVRATLVETRKGDKVKVFKKIRRQGYRRTKGHRQIETVLRVTGLEGAGKSATWDGAVDLTPRSLLRLRARGLAPIVTLDDEAPAIDAPTPVKARTSAKTASPAPALDEIEAPAVSAEAAPAAEASAPVEAKSAKPKASAKAKAALEEGVVDEQAAAAEPVAKPDEAEAPVKKSRAKAAKPDATDQDA